MTESEIVKIFKTYYDLLEREYDDRQLTIAAAAQLTNAHILQLLSHTLNGNTPLMTTILSTPIDYNMQTIKDTLQNINYNLERLVTNTTPKIIPY